MTAAVTMPADAWQRFLAWARGVVWPDAPRPVTRALEGHELVQTWLRTMHYAGAGAPGSTLDDMLWQARSEQALEALLRDYRAGRAQTPGELLLAQALDHVAQTYGRR